MYKGQLTDTVELTKHAKAQGCRGVLVLPPFYYKAPTDDGLFAYFSEVVNRTGGSIALYLYHFPQQSAVPFSLDLIGRLLKAFPGCLKGVKASSGDYANMQGGEGPPGGRVVTGGAGEVGGVGPPNRGSRHIRHHAPPGHRHLQ